MPILDEHSFEFFSHSPEQTRRLGARLGELLKLGDLIYLSGELGAGKTTMVQGIALVPWMIWLFVFAVGLLNSKLAFWYLNNTSSQLTSSSVRNFSIFIEKFPIPILSEKNKNYLEKLVGEILSSNSNNNETEIDKIIYELFVLTEEEVAIVEGKEK
jgi:archaellum biogenesis ATPase FlaH